MSLLFFFKYKNDFSVYFVVPIYAIYSFPNNAYINYGRSSMTTETSSQMIRPQVDMFEQPDPAAHLSTRFCGNVVTLSISEEANPKDQVVFKCSDITDCWRNLHQTSPVVKHKQSCCRVILGQSIGQSLGHIWDRSRSPWLN